MDGRKLSCASEVGGCGRWREENRKMARDTSREEIGRRSMR